LLKSYGVLNTEGEGRGRRKGEEKGERRREEGGWSSFRKSYRGMLVHPITLLFAEILRGF
jgi:hypothetical protein